MNRHLHAGIVQFDVKTGDIQNNIGQALAGVRALAEKGAEVAVLPELWAGGFHRGIKDDAQKTPAILDTMAKTAAECRMVIAGSLAESTGQELFNTLYIHDGDGSLAGQYRKIHLFSATGEDRVFSAGDGGVICATAAGMFGLVICYDIRFPELCRMLALNGAEGIIVCAQWPASRTHHWDALLRARAIENQLVVLAANRCGRDESVVYGGRSIIVTATGEVAASAGDTEPAVIHAVLDRTEGEEFRKAIPCLRERRPEAYRLR